MLMKKLLGIIVLGLLLGGCIQGPAGPLGVFNDKETRTNQSKYSYMAWYTLSKKGLNKKGIGYANTRSEAKANAMQLCRIEQRNIGVGTCYVGNACTSKGYQCDPSAAYLEKKKKRAEQRASNSSSGSKIDPSVWDDIISGSQGILSGKSTSESLGGTSSSSSSTSLSCFKKSESTTGTNKICIYNCMGSDVAVNVKSTRLCPMSIKK
jgi:hypothetical protein